MSLPDPYYADGSVTLYHGDCHEILSGLEQVDLVLTDPPYGIADVWRGGSGHGWGKAHKQKPQRNEWDEEPDDLRPLLAAGERQIIWGGNHFDLPASRGWLVWVKPERGFTLSEAELAWTSEDTVIRVLECRRSDPGRQHPTQTPLRVMEWCLEQSWTQEAGSVLDPYAGSGTTLVAAKNLGRRAVGIEIHEPYCEIAAERLSQQTLDLGAA